MKKNKKYTGIGKLIFNSTIYFFIAVIVISVLFGTYAVQRIIAESPQVDIVKINSYEPTKVLDRNEQLISTLGGEVRENIAYNDLPQVVVDAFLAVEDSRYQAHNGFDIPRFMKSFLVNVKSGGIQQGGSTITMQLVDNSFFNVDSSKQTLIQRLKQKISEITMGMELERKASKEDILTAYLNKINFGDKIRGIGKASEYYFGKPISQVNLSEAAFLAGVINAPNLFNPYNEIVKNEDGTITDYYNFALERRNTSLYLMKYHGYITQMEYDLAVNTPLAFQLAGTDMATSDAYLAYTDIVEKEVIELTGKNPHTVSMTIYTAMDKETQDLSNEISDKQHLTFTEESNLQVGAAVIDNVNHELIAVNPGFGKYAGDNRYNFAMVEKNQIGSTSKPLMDYAPAFDYVGYSTEHTFDVKPLNYRGTNFSVRNVDYNSGKFQLDAAIAKSFNTTALETFYKVWDVIGSDGYETLKNNLGLDTPEVTDQFSIGGGEFKLTPFELAGAYSAFANKGVYYKPTTVRKVIIHSTGEVFEPKKAEGKQAYSEQAAYLMSVLLEKNVSGGWGNSLGRLVSSYPVYAKTGTSDWGTYGSQYGIPNGSSKDLWVAAYSGNTTVATWIGYDSRNLDENAYFTWPEVLLQMPQRITKLLLDKATLQRENRSIVQPSGISKESHIKGVFPYMKVPESVKSENVASGLILSKFLNRFQDYKPSDLPTATGFTLKPNNDTKTLDFSFTEIKAEDQIYGKAQYKVLVKDSNGTVLQDTTYETATGKIDVSSYVSGKYTITGSYVFEHGTPDIPEQSYEYTHSASTNTPSAAPSENNNNN